MFRIVGMSGKVFALKIDSVEDDAENITDFVTSGDIVMLCDDLEDLSKLGIDVKGIQIVD